MAKVELSIVIPAYNEEATIGKVLRDIKEVMKKTRISYELIVVDDASRDNTAEIAKKERTILVQHPYNKGYGAALKTGARNAQGNYVLYIDADDQYCAEDTLKLIKYMHKYDMVIASRRGHDSFFRMPAKKILGFIGNYLADKKIPDLNAGFRIIKKDIIIEFIDILPNTFSFTTTITLAAIKSGYNLGYVPVRIKKREKGKSTIKPFNFFTFIILLLRTIMLFNPLKIFLPISLIIFLVSLPFIIIDIVRLGISDITVLLIISSIFVFCFGLIADQIALLRRTK